MFIYVLNLLNDSLKKNKACSLPAFEIINDTTYISKLAGIKRNFDFKSFSDNIIDIFRVFGKYKLTLTDGLGILNKLILNNNNSWILDNIRKELCIDSRDELELELNLDSLINSILLKYKIGDGWGKITCIAL